MAEQDTQRAHYCYFSSVTTRWMDNDIYGHVNNVTYYSYFDSVANQYLIEKGGLDIHRAETVGFVVASQCQYLAPITYPDVIDVGFRVNRLGRSSVEYGMAIFLKEQETAVAHGTFTHVFVNRASGESSPMPVSIRAALQLALAS
ncbi:MAG: acyl-CoA thioesterase [Gammaproteobacteria bacterium]|nr:acyl-CoA thioesterase [Gammaproteobacteria bacterium]